MNEARPYSISGTTCFDLAPSNGGAAYRIFLSIPTVAPPPQGWPLLVLTDGNAMFPFAVACQATQAPYTASTNLGWGVIAAIGYPDQDWYDPTRRSLDLTPPPGRAYPPFFENGPAVATGGANGLLAFIEDVFLPHLATLAPLDAQRRTLFGHSFGGLFALFALFARPGLFASFVAASPSIYWEDCQILHCEAERQLAPGNTPFLHLSAGEHEGDALAPFQRTNEDAAQRLDAKKLAQTIAHARDMAERLNGTADGVRTAFEVYAGETHMSVLAPAINRAVNIAFAVKPDGG